MLHLTFLGLKHKVACLPNWKHFFIKYYSFYASYEEFLDLKHKVPWYLWILILYVSINIPSVLPWNHNHNLPFDKILVDRVNTLPFDEILVDRVNTLPNDKISGDRVNTLPYVKIWEDRVNTLPFDKILVDRVNTTRTSKEELQQSPGIGYAYW